MKFKETIYLNLQKIPSGKVVTYSQLARLSGRPKAFRAVGNILHNNVDPIKYPCYKVVNNKGFLSKHYGYGGIEIQRKFLEADNITVINNRVDLKKYQWEK